MFKLDLEKAEEPEIKLPASIGSQKKQESSRKTSTSALLTMPKPLIVWFTTNWKILKEMGTPEYLSCLLRNLYAGQEATVRTGHGTTDWFQIGKVLRQDCVLSPCLFNFSAECIMRNARLEEAQAGIKIAVSYADDTTVMTESEEELRGLLMKVKEESEKVGLKFNIQKAKIVTSGPIASWQIDGEAVEAMRDFIFRGSKLTADGDYSHEIKRCLLLGSQAMTNLDSILNSRDITPSSQSYVFSSSHVWT